MRARKRTLLVRAGALAVLAGVVLPNLAFVGHWSGGGHAHPIHSEAAAVEHATHCHLGPSRCAGQADFTGAWWTGHAPSSITTGATERMVPSPDALSETDPPAARLLDPPRAA